MFNETSYGGASYWQPPTWQPRKKDIRFLGPPIRDTKGATCGRYDSCGAQVLDDGTMQTVPVMQDHAPPLSFGNDIGTPATGTIPGATTGAFDISSLLSGTTFGLPTWLLLSGAAWFFFFRKGR